MPLNLSLRVSSWIQPPEEVPEADINIFTVASGHLYEVS